MTKRIPTEEVKAGHIQAIQKINVTPQFKVPKTLVVEQDFNLMGLDPKLKHAESLPDFIAWVVFINKRGNLAHILHRDDPYSYIRMNSRYPSRVVQISSCPVISTYAWWIVTESNLLDP